MCRKKSMKNIIYLHICCINNWKFICAQILRKIHEAKLYDEVDEIRCVVLGNEIDPLFFRDPKMKVIFHSENIKHFEYPIMKQIYQDSLSEDFNILYLHTKGVTSPENKNITEWIYYMLFFNVTNYKDCLEKLSEYDVVGVNLREKNNQLQFEGNFWWSKSSYIRTLNIIEKELHEEGNEYIPVSYITSSKGTFFSFKDSEVNHYVQSYVKENYRSFPDQTIENKSYVIEK